MDEKQCAYCANPEVKQERDRSFSYATPQQLAGKALENICRSELKDDDGEEVLKLFRFGARLEKPVKDSFHQLQKCWF